VKGFRVWGLGIGNLALVNRLGSLRVQGSGIKL